MHKLLHILFLSATSFVVHAQAFLPINHYYRQEVEAYLQKNNLVIFSALRPVPVSVVHDTLFRPDSLLPIPGGKPYRWWIFRKLCQENLAVVRQDGFVLKVNGLADFSVGKENSSSRLLYRNTRGALFEGTIDGVIGFSSALYENQARFPGYITSYTQTHQVLPGQGIAKKYQTDGYDFSWAEGNLWIRPWKDLYFETGFGKRFFGDGYRSLLLSDFSNVYPYAGYRWYAGKFFLAASTQGLIQHEAVIRWDKRRFPAKTSVLHFAGAQLGGFQLTLMEATMFANPDSAGNFRWQPELFNPLPVLNSLSGSGNSLWGFNISVSLPPFIFYGQWLADEYPLKRITDVHSVQNKTGFQAGLKWFKAFSLPGMYLQAEYNQVRPYTYGGNPLALSFTHYNEPLAHPLGSNFREALMMGTYRYKFMLLESQLSYAVQGKNDGTIDWGAYPLIRNRTLPEQVEQTSQSQLLQGIRTEIMQVFAGVSWMINPVNTLHLSFEFHFRQVISEGIHDRTNFFVIALRTNRINHYYDF